MKEEAEALLSHFGIYLAVVFGSIVWESFTVSYRTSMEEFQYCSLKNCAIERDALTNEFDDSFDRDFAKCGFTNDQIEIPHETEFDLTHQVSLHVYVAICGILSDVNGDSGTIRSNLSDATLCISQLVLPKPINYLVPMQKPPSAPVSTKENPIIPTVTMNDTTSKEDAQDSSLPPAKIPSEEEASNNRSEGSSDN